MPHRKTRPTPYRANGHGIDGNSRRFAVDPLKQLDALDWAILRELQTDGRIAFAELGRRVGLGPSSVAERVRGLEDAGVIRGYRAELDAERIGLPITAFVRVRSHPGSADAFQRLVEDLPEVVECHHVTGEDCYLVKVVGRSIRHLEETTTQLASHGQTTTAVVFSTVVERRVIDREPAG